MEKPRLFKFLDVLSADEWASFLLFLKADYFGSSKEKSHELVLLLYQRYKKGKAIELTEKEEASVRTKLLGHSDTGSPQSVDKQKVGWGKLLSATTLLLENFLAVEALMKDELNKQLYVCKSIVDRQDDETLEISISKFEKKLAKAPQDLSTYDHQWRQMELESVRAENDQHAANPIDKHPLVQMEEMATASYHLRLLKTRTAQQSSQQVIRLERSQVALDDEALLALCEGYAPEKHPLIALYGLGLKAGMRPNEPDYYVSFLGMYLRSVQLVSSREFVDLGLIAINHAFRWHTQTGEDRFVQDMADVSDAVTRALSENPSRIQDQIYINFCLPLIYLGQYDKYDRLKRVLSDLLPPTWRHAAIDMIDGYYYFHKKEYNKALVCLGRISTHKVRYAIRSQSLLLRIQLELFLRNPLKDEELNLRLESFRIFLYRKEQKQISANRRAEYTRLHKYVTDIKAIKQSGLHEADKYRALLAELPKQPTLNASWLKNKLEELIQEAESLR